MSFERENFENIDSIFEYLNIILSIKNQDLYYVEKEILREVWKDKKYDDMVVFDYTIKYTQNLAAKLWKKLSYAIYGEPEVIKRKNVKEILDQACKEFKKIGLKGQIILNKYKVIKTLDNLSNNEVFKSYLVAYQGMYNYKYVLKEFELEEEISDGTEKTSKIIVNNERIKTKFNREVDFLNHLKFLSCPHVPTLMDSDETQKNKFYLAYKYIEGEVLSKTLLEDKPNDAWSEEQVLDLLKKLLNILVWLKNAEIVHRNIRPSNLILTPENGLFLINFDGATKHNMQEEILDVSTRIAEQYSALELAGGLAMFSSDIYSVGTVCIHALIGKPPNKKNKSTGEIHWRDEVNVSPELEATLTKMVRRDFEKRYKFPEEILQDL